MSINNTITITGSGLIGSALSLALAHKGFTIHLIDTQAYQPPPKNSTHPYIALNRTGENFLKQINIWPHLSPSACHPYHKVEVVDEHSPSELNFTADEVNEQNLGHILSIPETKNVLNTQINNTPTIKQYIPDQIKEIQKQNTHLTITLKSGKTIDTKLLIAADGKNSQITQQQHFETHKKPYHQEALVTTVTCEQPHNDKARQRFLSTGPLVFLPLSTANQCTIVWSTTPQMCRQLKNSSKAEICKQISAAFDFHYGQVTNCTPPISFPLYAKSHSQLIKNRTLLIGDAAKVIHPLAGQGANTGFADCIKLVETLTRLKQQQRDIGKTNHLNQYQLERKMQHKLTQLAMNSIKQLFTPQQGPIRLLRSLGLQTLNQQTFLKKQFQRLALFSK